MSNWIVFLNSFLSYLLLVAVFVVVAAVAVFIGVKLRKAKDTKEETGNATKDRTEG